MMRRLALTALLLALASPSWATTRYADLNLVSNCTSGNYSFQNRNCTGSDGNAYNTFSAVISPTVAGDTIIIRGGTWVQQMDFQVGNKTGTAGNPITVKGASGETVRIQYNVCTAYGNIKIRGNRGYFIFEDLIIDGSDMCPPGGTSEAGWSIRDGNHHFELRRLEITQQTHSGFLILNATDILIEDLIIHESRTDCTPGNRHYGLYINRGQRITVRRTKIYDMPGGGIQVYPGPLNDVQLYDNEIYNNTFCASSPVGGVLVGTESGGGITQNVRIFNNKIYKNGVATSLGSGGSGGGIRVGNSASFPIANIEIYNNTIYGNEAGPVGTSARGITIHPGTTAGAVTARNNLIIENETAAILDLGSGNTFSNNITTGTITDYTISTSNLNLKQGANSAVDAGVSVPTRLSWVGSAPDVGATERGTVASAVVASGFIEVTVNVMQPGVRPTSGLTAWTITNGTSTGTPVVTEAVVKAGANNIVQLTVSGFTGAGTCTVSYGAGNMTDSGFIGPANGPTLGTAQGVNSRSALAVSGTCDNTDGTPAPPAGGLYSEFLLDEGSGTTATDNGATNNGTVSAGVTWVDDTSGTGVYIPTAEEAGDSTYRAITSTYGASIDPTSESFSACILVLPDTQYSQKIPLSTGDYSSNRRAYLGWVTIGGVKRWGLGVQGSSFSSGATEFPLEATLTLACMRFNSATDTANLSINRTIGTSAAANKTYTSFTTTGDIRAGSDGTFTVNTGGVTIYGMWVWNATYISDAEVQALYDSLFPAGGSVGGYAEVTHRWQAVYLDNSETPVPINFKSIGAQEIEVVAGGAVAIEFQVNCTGGPCDPLAVRLHAADIAGNTGAVPQELDAFGLAMWRADTSSILNRGVSTCCLSGALTPVNGVTILDSVASNTIELAQDSSTMFRFIVRVATDQVGELYTLFLKQDNGAPLDGAAGTTPRIKVVPARASGVR